MQHKDKRWHGVVACVLILATLVALVHWSAAAEKSEGCDPRDDGCADNIGMCP